MKARDDPAVYVSSAPFDADRIRAVAIYCSDGRFGEQFDDFLHNGLKLPRCDRLAAPGAAALAGHFLAHREEDGLVEQLTFLIRAHGLERVVLIAHEDCAFYSQRLHVFSAAMEARQREDMQAAAERIRAIGRGLAVEAFFARKNADGGVRFEAIELR